MNEDLIQKIKLINEKLNQSVFEKKQTKTQLNYNRTIDSLEKSEKVENKISRFRSVSRNYIRKMHSLNATEIQISSSQNLRDKIKVNQQKFAELTTRKKIIEAEIKNNSDKIFALKNNIKFPNKESDLVDLIQKEKYKTEALINKIRTDYNIYKSNINKKQEFIIKNNNLNNKISELKKEIYSQISVSKRSPKNISKQKLLQNLREQYETVKREFEYRTLTDKNNINSYRNQLSDLMINLHFLQQVFF